MGRAVFDAGEPLRRAILIAGRPLSMTAMDGAGRCEASDPFLTGAHPQPCPAIPRART